MKKVWIRLQLVTDKDNKIIAQVEYPESQYPNDLTEVVEPLMEEYWEERQDDAPI